MKIKILFMLCTISIQFVIAQPKYYEKVLPKWAFVQDIQSIIALPDTTYIVAGNYTQYPEVKWFSQVAKIDKNAEIVWQTYFDTAGETGIYDIIQGNFGYYAMTGTIAEDYIANSPNAMCTYFVNGAGYFQSLSNYGQPETDSRAYRIIQTPDGGYLSVGYLVNGGYPYYTLYIVKLNPDGSKQWQRIYDDFFNYHCTFRDVMNASGGGYYLVGSVNMNWDPNPNLGNILLMKIDSVGNTIWTKIHNVGEMDQGLSLIRTIDGGLMVGGLSAEPGGQKGRPYLIKTDSMGNFVWGKRYFTAGGLGEVVSALQLPDGGYIAAGTYSTIDFTDPTAGQLDMFLLRTNATGNALWYRSYGNPTNSLGGLSLDYAYDFTPTLDGGYMIVGRKDSMLSATEGYAYAWLVKTNCMGLLTVPKAQFTLSQNPDFPNNFLFTNQSLYTYPDSIDGGYYHLDWGDGSPPYLCGQGYEPCSANAIPHTYQTEGIYGVTLQAIVCNDTSVAVQSVCFGVEPNPQAAFTYQDFGGIIQFTNLSQNAYLAQGGYYLWDFDDGSPPSSAENPTHEYEENGSYSVTLTLVVCQDTSVYMQEVVVQTVGVSPQNSPEYSGSGVVGVVVYPNPAQNTLQITLAPSLSRPLSEVETVFSLYTPAGQLALQTPLVSTGSTTASTATHTLSVAHLPAGIYFYMVSVVGGDSDNGNNNGDNNNGGKVLVRGKVAVVR